MSSKKNFKMQALIISKGKRSLLIMRSESQLNISQLNSFLLETEFLNMSGF